MPRRRTRGGSSPLARGLPPRSTVRLLIIRIIPARAGFTVQETIVIHLSRDHPRSRGVYSAEKLRSRTENGSSPLARGLRGVKVDHNCGARIIPARAGFTRRMFSPASPLMDHPRSRGVYPSLLSQYCFARGSSPLARGLLREAARGNRRHRIIPARAGFTRTRSRPIRGSWDHPRSRGVYLSPSPWSRSRRGSSPLARGLPG